MTNHYENSKGKSVATEENTKTLCTRGRLSDLHLQACFSYFTEKLAVIGKTHGHYFASDHYDYLVLETQHAAKESFMRAVIYSKHVG